MARRNSALEFNTFVRGLITEAGPLTFPDNASLSEVNWVLAKDGSRRRRDGMNFEPVHTVVETNQSLPPTNDLTASTFLWENAGGRADLQIVVVHIQNQISFFRRGELSLSSGLLHQDEVTLPPDGNPISYASVDGRLVVTNGSQNIHIFSIDQDDNITRTLERLKIRDLTGVGDIDALGRDLLSPEYIALRPTYLSDNHLYNLLNQTWGPKRLGSDNPVYIDPIAQFYAASGGRYTDGVGSPVYDSDFVEKASLEIVSGVPRVVRNGVLGAYFYKDRVSTFDGYRMDILSLKKSTVGTAPTSLDYRGDSGAEVIGPDDTYLIWNGTSWNTFQGDLVQIGEITNNPLMYPSNADSVLPFLFPNPNPPGGGSPFIDRFHVREAVQTQPGSSRAPTGFFIIDALNRGTSRMQAVRRYNEMTVSLPLDTTPGGARAVTSYAGRVFYAGFSGPVVDGDNQSPQMESYVLFSKLVRASSDITRCYQMGDPTSKDEPDLLDTDGGYIKVDGAYGIKSLVNIGGALLVLASNGVWVIQGGAGYGFSATNYLVQKISDLGIIGPESSVVVDGNLLFWGIDGIYQVGAADGRWTVQSITRDTIQSFYLDIPDEDKRGCKGFFDSYEGRVRWLYGTYLVQDESTKELVLDVTTGAFLPQEIKRVSDGLPVPVGFVQVAPYSLSEVSEPVTVNGEVVTVDGEPVVITVDRRRSATMEVAYLTILSKSPITFTFSTYNDRTFMDWRDYDGVGVDSPAHLITGYISGGDFQRYKQIQYLTTHFERTETEFTLEGGDVVSVNDSSCLIQAIWEWTNSPNSNRWGREFQAYRYIRHYIPDQAGDQYDTGFRTIVTKHKIRGKGRVVSIKFRTEPGKDCHIHGWSMILGINGNV